MERNANLEKPRSEMTPEQLVCILERSTDVVVVVDKDGTVLFANASARKGFSESENAPLNQERRLQDLHAPWAWELLREEGIPTAGLVGTWSGESAIILRDGTELPVMEQVVAMTGRDGEIDFIAVVCRDISDRKREDMARIEWTNRYDAAVRASGQVVFDWDSVTGDIEYGGNVEQLLGYTNAELTGGVRRLEQLISREDLAQFRRELQGVAETRDPVVMEFRTRRKDEQWIVMRWQGYFFLDRRGRSARMVGFLSDETARRRAEEIVASQQEELESRVEERTRELNQALDEIRSRARQQEVVAALGQEALAGLPLDLLQQAAVETVATTLDADFAVICELNEELAEFEVTAAFGVPEELRSVRIPANRRSLAGYIILIGDEVHSPDFGEEKRFTTSPLAEQVASRCGAGVPMDQNSSKPKVLAAFSARAGHIQASALFFLRSVANVLSTAVERHEAEGMVRMAQQAAETANRAKSEFLSRMSHELRTPLNAILGFAQLLEMEPHTPEQAESIGHIVRAGRNLLSMINEVLDLTRIDVGRVQFSMEPLSLMPFILAQLETVEPLAAKMNVQLTLDPLAHADSAWICSDRERLRQVLLNLLSNAIKYNRPGGLVRVSVLPAPPDGWCVHVLDTGCGIAPEAVKRLSQPFERIESESHAVEPGSGLGLALTYRIVQALGGTITCTSAVGKGSRFSVRFPRIASPEETPGDGGQAGLLALNSVEAVLAAPLATPRGAGGKTFSAGLSVVSAPSAVLYVEDDVANVYLLERIMESRGGVRLLSAQLGRLGLELAAEHRPKLLLLDLNLPDLTGEEFLKRLHEQPSTAGIPVVAVTGEVSTERVQGIMALGAVALLSKPYDVAELMGLIDRYVR